jgi:hypothetical protein
MLGSQLSAQKPVTELDSYFTEWNKTGRMILELESRK